MRERWKRRRQAVTRILRTSLSTPKPVNRHVVPIADGAEGLDLAFVSFQGGNRSIWITGTDSSGDRAIPLLRGLGNTFDPAWSFDGSTLVFVSDVDGRDNVHSLDLATGAVTRLTSNDADHRYPALSPDGTTIVYLRACWPRAPQIWMMEADGANPRESYCGPGYKVRPTFRPDGSSVTVQINRPHPGIHSFLVTDDRNSAGTDLSRNRDQDTYPSWSPDGTRIAFAKTESTSLDAGMTAKQIWVMDADGSNPHAIVSFADARHPVWSADGEWIVFDADTSIGRQIFFIRPDGQDLHRITSSGDNHTPACRRAAAN